jgi:hypothetical protein
MLLHEVINEIKGHGVSASSRSVHEIYNMLENNRLRFESRIGADDFKGVLTTFRELTGRKPADYTTARFKDEYDRAFNLLMFYLGKIL